MGIYNYRNHVIAQNALHFLYPCSSISGVSMVDDSTVGFTRDGRKQTASYDEIISLPLFDGGSSWTPREPPILKRYRIPASWI